MIQQCQQMTEIEKAAIPASCVDCPPGGPDDGLPLSRDVSTS